MGATHLKSKIIRATKRVIKDSLLYLCLPVVYQRAARSPLEKGKILFVERKEELIPDSFGVIYSKLIQEESYHVEYISLHESGSRFLSYWANCISMVKKLATAEVVFINDASDVISCVPLRAGTRVVQLWHGCGAFKKWGMSTADLKFGGSREELARHPFYKNLTLVTVSSPEVVWAYEEAMDLPSGEGIVVSTGVSRTDVFFDEDFLRGAREMVIERVPEAASKKIILYAPTFRGRVAKAGAPQKLDINAFKEALGDSYILLIKHHPFVKKPPAISSEHSHFAFDVSSDLPIDALLSVADICISDYSSLVFEYSLFGRPLVFFAYDKEDYDDWRGFYYNYNELTPGPVFSDNAAMIDYLVNIEERFDKTIVEEFRNRFMRSCDGRSTDRILDIVFENRDSKNEDAS